jgi:hypothetical protein
MKVEFNQTSLAIFKMWQLDAKNNTKTPLGLLSMMININHNNDYVNQNITSKENEMEF